MTSFIFLRTLVDFYIYILSIIVRDFDKEIANKVESKIFFLMIYTVGA